MWPFTKKITQSEIRNALAIDRANQRITLLEANLINLQVIQRQIVAGNKIIVHQLAAIRKATPAGG